eukprot:scaffold834_cov172-Amphora_coffeaeformis.AAC.4
MLAEAKNLASFYSQALRCGIPTLYGTIPRTDPGLTARDDTTSSSGTDAGNEDSSAGYNSVGSVRYLISSDTVHPDDLRTDLYHQSAHGPSDSCGPASHVSIASLISVKDRQSASFIVATTTTTPQGGINTQQWDNTDFVGCGNIAVIIRHGTPRTKDCHRIAEEQQMHVLIAL